MRSSSKFFGVVFFLIFVLAGIAAVRQFHQVGKSSRLAVPAIPVEVQVDPYLSKIQPLFTARCVACHACYNSPCQLNLGSYSGFARGSSQIDPYDFPLIEARHPTRLDIDETTVEGWRNRGFTSVETPTAQLVALNNNQQGPGQTFNSETSRSCPSTKTGELAEYIKAQPAGGMPFGFPALTDAEKSVLQTWLATGAKGPSAEAQRWLTEAQTPSAKREIPVWEDRLNETSMKARLSARYLYEHLLVAHISFSDDGREFFRLVRAKNREGVAIEIPTVRPFDDPGPEFYYRFKKIDGAIVHKVHTVFAMTEKVRLDYERDFMKSEWLEPVDRMPAYGNPGANAFKTFRAIPRQVRYRFFLEHARYFVMSFMKGPVCRGQTALNVIDDHFWLTFLDPKFDLSAKDPIRLMNGMKDSTDQQDAIEELMDPPAIIGNKLEIFNKLKERRWQANVLKTKMYVDKKVPFNTDAIWNGEGRNPNALLTIYRHFDSSDVRFGAEGENPKTVWVFDYQIFEDVYYNLVAGYNLFGPLLHQLDTRLYMEVSRISSEDMFLNFLPADRRLETRQRWSHDARKNFKAKATTEILSLFGASTSSEMKDDYPFPGSKIVSLVNYKTQDVQTEFVATLFEQRLESQVRTKPDFISRPTADRKLGDDLTRNPVIAALSRISGKKAGYAAPFPDASLLRIRMNHGEDLVYSVVHNKAHANVNLLFFESLRREQQNDTLNILPGFAQSYPNYYFVVKEDDLGEFVNAVEALAKNPVGDDLLDKYEATKNLNPRMASIAKRFGVSRHRADFWMIHDWFNAKFETSEPLEAGLLDLNRYLND